MTDQARRWLSQIDRHHQSPDHQCFLSALCNDTLPRPLSAFSDASGKSGRNPIDGQCQARVFSYFVGVVLKYVQFNTVVVET
jgi:hypothetical protein